ncbi:GAF domain-containing protein [Rhodoglobus vestalii]|uniref:GAF domain-containing protein n=2 Tax=Rhodoglobus vestalii TaxID=193384 RepID=A0A8H2PWY1_9MICO|nr:GAF domain-containing protein [Rhodoglobus vestalii]
MCVPVPPKSWLSLLVDEASETEFRRHRDLLSDAQPPINPESELALALEIRAMLVQRRQRMTELAALNDISVRLSSSGSFEGVLRLVVENAKTLLGVDLAYLGLVEDDQLAVLVTAGAITQQLPTLRLPLNAGVFSKVVRGAAPFSTRDYQQERRITRSVAADAAAAGEHIRGLLGVPLRSDDEVIGALFVAKRSERQFSADEESLLSVLASHAAVAIQVHRTVERLQDVAAEQDLMAAWDETFSSIVSAGAGLEPMLEALGRLVSGDVVFTEGAIPRSEPGAKVELRASGRIVGYLHLYVDDYPVGPRARAISRIAPMVALAIESDRSALEASRRSKEAAVLALLTQPGQDFAALRHRIRSAGIGEVDRHRIVVFSGGTGEPIDSGALRQRFSDVILVDHDGYVVGILSPASMESVMSANCSISHMGLFAAVSDPVATDQLASAFDSTRELADAMAALGRNGMSVPSDLAPYSLLLSFAGRDRLKQFVDERLGALLATEARRNIPLLETVGAFLETGQRPSATAAQLGVHVNTIYQRLTIVDGVLGTGWRQTDEALGLLLLIRTFAAAQQMEAVPGTLTSAKTLERNHVP